MTDVVRLLAKVCIASDGCWLWTAGKYSNGYGAFRFQGRVTGAHRASYVLLVGPIPDGLDVLHRCDRPACINPRHLFTGTHADNMHDKNAKGRGNYAFGARQGWTHLTDEDIIKIRTDTRLQKDIAAAFGIGRSTVSTIRTRKTWYHV